MDFSVDRAVVKANIIFLIWTETANSNDIAFYQKLVKVMAELPNLPINQ